MNPTQLLAHFDRIIEAPDAIPRLRRFVLDLAVRGKLIEQDPKEKLEPARRDWHESRNRQAPFQVPGSWTWARVGDVADCRLGKMLDKAKNRGTPQRYLRNVNVRWFDFDLSDVLEMRFEDAELDEFSLRQGDVLICEGGEPGRAAVWDEREADIYFQKAVHRVRLSSAVDSHFFVNVLRQSADSGTLDAYFTGVGIKHFTGKGLASFVFPLPSVAEQHRIVAKVDELMALCDRLDATRAERESRRDLVSAASLNRLNQPAADALVFREHASFQLDRLPRLVTMHRHVEQLRQTILNLAVRGQLVSQDPHDEPAVRLLQRIAAQRRMRLNAGASRRETTGLPATANDLAFQIKSGWEPARISQIVLELQTGPFGSSLHQSDYRKGGTPVINPASIKNGGLVAIDKMAVGPETLERLANFKLNAGDIVLARRGEMGRCAIVSSREHGWLCGTGTLILRLPECLFAPFFVMLLGAPFVREYLGGSAVGATMQNLNQSILLALVIGVPPFAEQQRIVAKVNELMTVCDQLESQLLVARTEASRLLDALLFEALGSVRERREDLRVAGTRNVAS